MVTCHTCPATTDAPEVEDWLGTRSDAALAAVMEGSAITDQDVWVCRDCAREVCFNELKRRGRLHVVAEIIASN